VPLRHLARKRAYIIQFPGPAEWGGGFRNWKSAHLYSTTGSKQRADVGYTAAVSQSATTRPSVARVRAQSTS